MAIQKIQICIIVGLFLFHVIQETIASSGEVNLTEYIFKNYHKNIRPQLSAQDPVKILTSVAFFQLLRIDEKEEVMTLNVWVRMKWNDTRLTWTPANFDNIQSLNVDVDNLWHPDIHLFNSVDSGTVFPSTSEGDLGFRAKISSDGFVEFSRPMILKLSCTMSIADYPYDTQNCTLIMGSWAHDITMMDMILAEDAVDMKSYRASEGWLVQNISAEKRYVTYECCNEPFTTLVYSMFIERSSLFYSINYVLPAVNLVFLSLLMFTVPPEVGKRMECGINLLLCVAVYLILINAKVPSTSLAFPVLSKFYACAIFILVIGMYCTTSVYAYYFHDPTGRGIYLMKHRFKVVVLYWMARIFLFPHGYRKGPDGKFVPVSSLQWGSESCNTDRQTPRLQKPKTVQNSLPGNEEQQYKIENKTKMMNQSERNDSGFQENDKPSSRGRSKSGENESRSSILKSSRITPEDEDIINRRNIFAKREP